MEADPITHKAFSVVNVHYLAYALGSVALAASNSTT